MSFKRVIFGYCVKHMNSTALRRGPRNFSYFFLTILSLIIFTKHGVAGEEYASIFSAKPKAKCASLLTFSGVHDPIPQTRDYSRLEQFVVSDSRFMKANDRQLEEQWKGSALNLPMQWEVGDPPIEVFSGKLKFGRGERVRLKRTSRLTLNQLEELISTGQHTSKFLAVTMKYDTINARAVLREEGISGAIAAIEGQREAGNYAISTAFAGKISSTFYRTDRPLEAEVRNVRTDTGQRADDGSIIWNTTRVVYYNVLLEYDVPSEALVVLDSIGDSKGIPKHVKSNYAGYGFLLKNDMHVEFEVTFLDLIPKQWLVTDLQKIKNQLTHLKRDITIP